MEILGLVDLPTWLLVCIAIVLTFIVYTSYKKNTFWRLGIMTKPTNYIFGDLGLIKKQGLQLYDLATYKKYGKVFGTYWGNHPFIVISDLEMIKEITVKQFHKFTERFRFESKLKSAQSSITVAEGDHWRYLRSTLSPCFTTGKIKKMNANISTCLEKLHSNLQHQSKGNPEGFDVVPLLQGYTLDVICSIGFGMDIDSQKDPDNAFVRHAQATLQAQFQTNPMILLNCLIPDLPGLSLMEIQLFPKDSFDFFKQATLTMLEERRKTKSDYADLLQTMVNVSNERDTTDYYERSTQSIEEMKQKGLTDDEVIVNSIVFMLASFDTTSATLSWLIYDMAVYTDIQEKLIEEIDKEIGQSTPVYESVSKLQYLDMVVNETLRFHPVTPLMTRKAVENAEICGVPIRKGMGVIFSAVVLHFLPEYWDDPELYNPDRFGPDNKHNLNEYVFIPFGLGPRNCIGMRLALTEVKMTLTSILQKYRIVRSEQLKVPMESDKRGSNKPGKPVSIKLEERKL